MKNSSWFTINLIELFFALTSSKHNQQLVIKYLGMRYFPGEERFYLIFLAFLYLIFIYQGVLDEFKVC